MFDEKTPLGKDIKAWAKKSNREVLYYVNVTDFLYKIFPHFYAKKIDEK